MERFIGIMSAKERQAVLYLKSSMERFIVLICSLCRLKNRKFKIQYGEIYSNMFTSLVRSADRFKIQYGEIYSCRLCIQQSLP